MAEDSDGGRKLRAKERKKYIDQDIDEDDIDGRRMYSVEEKLQSDQFNADMVQELKGHEFTLEWLQKNGLSQPIVFYDKTGLGLRVPSENFKVSDVKQCVGSRRILDVMDVNTQKAMEMSMKDWVKYYENPERDRLLNVISLEFCHTRLENYVDSPTLVRQIDWVDRAWPRHLKECQTESTNLIDRMKYPKVQKYCLMSVAGCYTDFHIDFGGTSVWYHILHGQKIFWLAPPSTKNIERYTEWTLSAKQGDSFLGDSLENCQRIQLDAGYTFIIPSGWIHAVYTPMDSLVFGGNFLHSFNIENQLLVSKIEDKTYVPSKFRYPFFLEIMWYVLDRYLSCLTGRTQLASCEKEEMEDDDPGMIHVDEDSRPPSRNPDSRPPSRTMDESGDGGKSGEDTPKLSKSVTIELTRIDATLSRGQSEEETSSKAQAKPRVPKKQAEADGYVGKKWVHLTAKERDGIRHMADYLSTVMHLPPSKRGIPKDMIDPEAVLREIRQLLEDHKNDDPALAISGEPSIGWSEASKKKNKLKLGYKTFKASKSGKGQANASSAVRRRRTRCKQCEACTRSECGECTFCKDMRKFGGPGRMKQTCISRQCMAPVLPSSSVCLICNHEGQTSNSDSEDISMQLMECGICWEIVHPACIHKKFDNLDNEGAVNEDLPNSWECPKCCNNGRQGQLKPRVRPGIPTVKKVKEESRFPADSDGSQDEEALSPISPVEGKRVTSKAGNGESASQQPIKSEGDAKRLSGVSPEMKVKREDASPDNQRKKGLPGNNGNGKDQQQQHRKQVKKEQSPSPHSPSQDDPRGGGGKKRPSGQAANGTHSSGKGSPHSQQSDPGGKRPKREGQNTDDDAVTHGSDDSCPTKKSRGSYEGHKTEPGSGTNADRDQGVGRSEHSSSSCNTQNSFSSFPLSTLSQRPPGMLTATTTSSSSTSSSSTSTSTSGTADSQTHTSTSSISHGKNGAAADSVANSGQEKGREGGGPSSDKLRWGTDYAPKVPLKHYVVRPAPPANIPQFLPLADGTAHPLPQELWALVFRFLPQSDLARLSAVCRTFDCWSLDPLLWGEIDLSRLSVKQTHLKFVMLRQPQSLKLASSVVSYAQLSWLIARLPSLRYLDLSNLSWASICALCSSDCPLLKALNLSWATGIRDLCFRELASPPVNLKPGQRNISRLCRLERLSLTGTDINDQSLEIIAAHLPRLVALDLTCCMRVTDRGIRALVQLGGGGGPCRLRELRLAKCVQLTERCLDSLSGCRDLTFLALTDIPAITQEECVRFSRNYRHRTLRAHAHGIISDC